MSTTITYEVHWTTENAFSVRATRKQFPDVQAAKDFKHTQAAKHPYRRYTVVKITVEEVA